METTFSYQRTTPLQWRARFRVALAAALTRQKMSQRALAEAIDVRPQTVQEWLRGKMYPMPELATRLAEALDHPPLAEMVLSGRTVVCEICGAQRVSEHKGGSAQVYCTPQCKQVAHDRRRRNVRIVDTHLTRHRLTDHQQAVAAMCHDCTLGEGLCEQWRCPLRPVSPIPLSLAAKRAQAAAS